VSEEISERFISFLWYPKSEKTVIEKEFFKDYGLPPREELFTVITVQWNLPERECQHTALLFQLKYKQLTDIKLLSKYIVNLSGSKEFFVRKAIGWVLREYSKTNPDWVRTFLAKHQLSGLSYREASKYL
jgi:3-methyladenine DNA glycosylase AlkD